MADDALIAALVELEHHVGQAGWDQPARLFALVRTSDLLAAEPQLADHLGVPPGGYPDGALSSIEQDDFGAAGDRGSESDLPGVLARITWPETVEGCALALERTFLPARFEHDLPEEPSEAERVVSRHPERQDLRLVVGVLRGGATHAFARLVRHPEDLLGGPDLAPGVASALAATLDHDRVAGLRQDPGAAPAGPKDSIRRTS